MRKKECLDVHHHVRNGVLCVKALIISLCQHTDNQGSQIIARIEEKLKAIMEAMDNCQLHKRR